MLVTKNTTNDIISTIQKLHTFYKHLMELHSMELYL